ITLLLSTTGVQVFAQSNSAPAPKVAPTPQVLNVQGVSIEFNVTPIRSQEPRLIAGEEARLGFKITGTTGAVPLSNLRPVAWIDQRKSRETSEPKECREKVQSFLQSSFAKRPVLDLNAYFILTLNQEPNISVIDPISGFGGSKLYNLIALPSPGEDWVMRTSDQNRLYVSMPAVNQVAVIDMTTWKSIATIDAGTKPTRVALQNDGRYLWVGSEQGVNVIDTSTLKVVAEIKTGTGHHEFAFTDDDRFAFVTNKHDGTLSVIDTRKLARVKDLKVGAAPVDVAFLSLSKAAYVANQDDGTIVVIDAAHLQILTQIKSKPGLRSIRLQPDGRYGFALNPAVNAAYVFDLTSNKLLHTVPVGPGADQITFTKQFAYIRSSGSEFVNMIKLADLGKEAALSRFPAGQKAPKESAANSLASAIVPAPEEGAVLVANPSDKMIYYYTEGMAAPMGSFQNYRRVPKALLVLDNGLRETARGIYSTTIRLDAPGFYDAVFLLDSPRAVHCFDFTVDHNPAQTKPKRESLVAQQLTNDSPVVGESYNLRFRIIETSAGVAKANLNDLGVLVYLAPGIWQERVWAKPVAGGAYEIKFVPPQPGVYYVHFRIPSLDVPFSQIMPLVLEVRKK
ncbi:MAG TPA: cytochrome D1 domain-containing protein, partial [Pyrinomonadaceae bacterium]|nr:cytochrome D1 domain-containing protein [Pyrinomonadaceae bacterium]